jgi:hypothetical protein
MKKKLMIGAAVAAIASAPAITGLVGNASFAQSVPVHVPAGARTIDDHGSHTEPGDDRSRRPEPGDDRSGARDPDSASSTRGSDDSQAPGSMTTDDGGPGRGGHDDGAADQ